MTTFHHPGAHLARSAAMRRLGAGVLSCLILSSPAGAGGEAPATAPLSVRGHGLTLRIYGARGRPAAVVASGDGGWIHLGPYAAEYLSSQGWFVVGFDTKAYLSAFTTRDTTLKPADVPTDFMALVEYAARAAPGPPVLIGVSEGAGLAVLAAADPAVKTRVAGVLALGLPDKCELGWRFRDSLIYLTKGVPKEPTFSTADVIGKVAPLPVAAIHSTGDEFVAADEVKRVMSRAGDPSRLWFIQAENHRFSGNTDEFKTKVLEALDWIEAQRR